jgi:eukaryotic-like serine/threonine-protein kinase
LAERIDSTLVIAGAETLAPSQDAVRRTLAEGDAEGSQGPSALPRGAALGRYLVLRELGRGGMGVVYAAYDPELDRRVAIKLLHDARADLRERNKRLVREAQTLAKLSHPHVIAVHDVGTWRDRVFIAMEFVDGGTLRQWLEQQRPWRELIAKLVDAGRGLAAAHSVNLVHRDFKPENVLLASDPRGARVVVADFGLARAQLGEDGRATSSVSIEPELGSGSLVHTPLTMTGAMLGTPAYMAPEQHAGREPEARTDQFAFAVVAWEGLYGRRPFAGDNLAALACAVTMGEIAEPEDRRGVPRHVHAALLRALATAPADRWPDMDALLAELARSESPPRWRAPLVMSATLASVVGVTVWASSRGDVCEGGRAQIETVWNGSTRARIDAAFAATGVRYAAATADTVGRALDARAAGWIDAHHQACAATRIGGEQSEAMLDMRMLCLARRQRELGAWARVLGEADAAMVRGAIEATHRLVPIESCADLEALAGDAPPPADPGVRTELDAIDGELAEIDALRHAGHYLDAIARAEPLRVRSEAIGRSELDARVQLVLATLYDRAGRHPEALESAKAAVWAAEVAGIDRIRVAAIARVITTLGERLRRMPEAADWVALGRAVLARLGEPDPLVATFEEHVGNLRYAEGDYPAALAAKDRALAIRERIAAPDDPVIASLLGSRGSILNELGRFDEAIAAQRRTLELRTGIFGAEHPATAMAHNNLGSALLNGGVRAEAMVELERALALWQDTLEPGHPDLAMAHNNIANALASGSAEERVLALDHYRQSIEIWTAARGPEDLRVGYALSNMGRALWLAGRPAEAITPLERALAIQERVDGSTHGDLVYVLLNLAEVHAALDEQAAALGAAERALGIAAQRLGPAHQLTARALVRLGTTELVLAREQSDAPSRTRAEQRALERLERALASCERNHLPDEDLAVAAFALAQALDGLGRAPARARTLASRAASAHDAAHQPDERDRVRAWLLARGDPPPR